MVEEAQAAAEDGGRALAVVEAVEEVVVSLVASPSEGLEGSKTACISPFEGA